MNVFFILMQSAPAFVIYDLKLHRDVDKNKIPGQQKIRLRFYMWRVVDLVIEAAKNKSLQYNTIDKTSHLEETALSALNLEK